MCPRVQQSVFSRSCFWVFVGMSIAQTSKGTLAGEVRDPRGAVVANASVTVVEPGDAGDSCNHHRLRRLLPH